MFDGVSFDAWMRERSTVKLTAHLHQHQSTANAVMMLLVILWSIAEFVSYLFRKLTSDRYSQTSWAGKTTSPQDILLACATANQYQIHYITITIRPLDNSQPTKPDHHQREVHRQQRFGNPSRHQHYSVWDYTSDWWYSVTIKKRRRGRRTLMDCVPCFGVLIVGRGVMYGMKMVIMARRINELCQISHKLSKDINMIGGR